MIEYGGIRLRKAAMYEKGHVHYSLTLLTPVDRINGAKLTMDARDMDGRTRVVTNGSINLCIGRFRNGPITRLAERVASRRLDQLLYQLEVTVKEAVVEGQRLSNDPAVTARIRRGLMELLDRRTLLLP